MTKAAILKAIHALPMHEQMKIIEQVIHSLRLAAAPQPSSDNTSSNSPSPSGDPWFDDPRNIAIVMEGIESRNKEKDVVLKSKEEIKQYFANQ